jgi:hypothetical protein
MSELDKIKLRPQVDLRSRKFYISAYMRENWRKFFADNNSYNTKQMCVDAIKNIVKQYPQSYELIEN